ncbi:hypothetical protein EYC58_04775 [Candidatus Saccharibacteria bacterium]|nr:MAG: hypothetical protein EYC58_04775 [Candidatus Saccharibacteria bacterium]
MPRKGIFIVIDGSDGTGKKTQHQLLLERLEQEGIANHAVDFPRYGAPSAYFVEQYLAGDYGAADEVSPEKSSIFYALDRFAAAKEINEALAEGRVVVANRFTLSNMGHQGAKLANKAERAKLYQWIDTFEHETLGVPRPDMNIILTIPHSVARANIDRRSVSDNRVKDIHEANDDFMRRSIDVYRELGELFDTCLEVKCEASETAMKTPQEIHKTIWNIVNELRSTAV